jgi:hypothetical protein
LPPEESVIWRKVFTQLWNDKVSKNQVAAELCLPTDEIENLVFGLVGQSGAQSPAPRTRQRPQLQLVRRQPDGSCEPA